MSRKNDWDLCVNQQENSGRLTGCKNRTGEGKEPQNKNSNNGSRSSSSCSGRFERFQLPAPCNPYSNVSRKRKEQGKQNGWMHWVWEQEK